MGLPEVFYGNNHLYFINASRNLLLEICPLDSVGLSSFTKREELLRTPSLKATSAKVDEDEKVLNLIDVIPSKLEV